MTETSSRPLKVFLCHAKEDKPKVRELYRRLRTDVLMFGWMKGAYFRARIGA
jgi:hypothetical protein